MQAVGLVPSGFTRSFVLVALTAVVVSVALLHATSPAQAQEQYSPSVRPPGNATQAAPGQAASGGAPKQYDPQLWTKVRQGTEGTVSIPDKKAGILVDASGDTWTGLRNGDYMTYGAYGLGGMLLLLALFFLMRGRIKVDAGLSGSTIQRFGDVERASHWLLAVSFIVLAVSGLNIIYGKYVLMPIMGKAAFAQMSIAMKYLHNYVAFAFMVGLVLSFIVWVKHNFPNKYDAIWLAKGGGLLTGGHPPAKKFNAGQKILFWLVILSGVSLSLSGLALLFPYQLPMFAKTFAVINEIGAIVGLAPGLPTDLTLNEEQQYATLWHGILAIVMTMVVIAHIYIGSIGMQGAFDAMGTGEVDVNWAKEHHSLWAEEVLEAEREEVLGHRVQPAE